RQEIDDFLEDCRKDTCQLPQSIRNLGLNIQLSDLNIQQLVTLADNINTRIESKQFINQREKITIDSKIRANLIKALKTLQDKGDLYKKEIENEATIIRS